MNNKQEAMYDFLSAYLTKGDLYAANAIAQISFFIIEKRKSLKMTQKEFAKMMGVSQGMVSKWESATYNFTIESIGQISDKLGTSFDIVFKPENEYLNDSVVNQTDYSQVDITWDAKFASYKLPAAA